MCATQAPEPEDTRPTWLLYWLVAEWVALALSIPFWLYTAVSVSYTIGEYQMVYYDEPRLSGDVIVAVLWTYPLWGGALVAGAWWSYARYATHSAIAFSAILTVAFAYLLSYAFSSFLVW